MNRKIILSLALASLMAGCQFGGTNQTSSSTTTSSSKTSVTNKESSTLEETSTSLKDETSDSSLEDVSSSSSSEVVESSSSSEDTSNKDVDVRLEAEDGAVGQGKINIVNCSTASGGKYVGDINDCGQGLYFIHYAAVGGVHDVEIAYYTQYANSKHELVVNDVAQTVVYDQNTGWGDVGVSSATVTVQAEFVQGYNIITLSKKGTAEDNPAYGGWVQVDYIDVKGTGVEIDRDSLEYNLEQFKVEAELGNFYSGSSCPVGIDGASNGYVVGEINSTGHGATFTLNIPEDGKYALQIAYGKDAGARPIDIDFDGTAYTYSLEDYDNQSWNNFYLSATAAVFEVEAGVHTLSIERAENSKWFCFDYFVLTSVE